MLIENIIMSIYVAVMVLYGLICALDNDKDDQQSKKSTAGNFIGCSICLLIAFFGVFHYITMEINKQVNDEINELKEELNIETTTTTTATTIPTTITDDNGNIYVLQPTTENN